MQNPSNLHLKVLPNGQSDILHDLHNLGRQSLIVQQQSKAHRKIEGVKGCLVLDNQVVSLFFFFFFNQHMQKQTFYLQSVRRKIQLSRTKRREIQQLSKFSLIRGLVKQLQKISIVWAVAEILFQQNVNLRLNNEAVVDCDISNSRTLGILPEQKHVKKNNANQRLETLGCDRG